MTIANRPKASFHRAGRNDGFRRQAPPPVTHAGHIGKARYLPALALAGLGMTVFGCGAASTDDPTPGTEGPGVETPDTETASQGLKLHDVLCSAMKALHLAVPGIPDPNCKAVSQNNLHYEGGFVPAGNLGDLFKLPPLTNTMIQCAVANSNTSASEGVVFTPVGQFGVSSRFAIIDRSVTPQFVEAQRIGSIFIFGAQADLDIENIRFDSSFENRRAGTTSAVHVFTGVPYTQTVDARTGTYLRVQSETSSWNVGGSVTIPMPVPITLTLRPHLGHTPLYESLGNTLVSPVPAPGSLFDFNTQFGSELLCIAARCPPGILCPCQADPTTAQLTEHERTCNGAFGLCDYGNVNDNVLPYDGALGGATQSSLYDAPLVNWFHFGPAGKGGGPVSGTLASGAPMTAEPVHDLGGSNGNPNTQFGLDIDAGYSLGPASLTIGIGTNVNLRSGFAVRQRFTPSLDRGTSASIETSLDSQSAIDIKLNIKVDFPIFGPFTASFPIFGASTTNRPSTLAAITYLPQENSAPLGFTVAGETRNAATEIGKCLQPPTVLARQTEPGDPASFLTNIGRRSVANVHPCHAKLCDAQSHLTTCEWDTTVPVDAQKLNCTTSATACSTCRADQNFLTLCGADNQPLVDMNGKTVTVDMTHNIGSCIR
jgi:hypothetical protein